MDSIRGISSMAMRQVLADLANVYRQRAGQSVEIVSVGGVDAARRIQDGEAFDFVVLAADAVERLVDAGRVVPESRTDLARSGIAIATATGAPRPDVGSEAAVREAVLRARAVGYSTGPSGTYILRLFEHWGIAPRTVQASPGVPVGTLIARGEVDLGFQQASELIGAPGIDVIGPLPAEIQMFTVFSAGISTTSRCRPDSEALLAFLASADADAAKRRHGMEPPVR